ELDAGGDFFADGAGYRQSVRAAQDYIAAGDIFQVVLSRRRSVECPCDPFTVYRALRMVNPSPYMYFLKDGARAVAGASPEMLVRVEGRRAETRPIAGTRPRGATPEEDERLGKELLAGAKERGGHGTLGDPGRNGPRRGGRCPGVRRPEVLAGGDC